MIWGFQTEAIWFVGMSCRVTVWPCRRYARTCSVGRVAAWTSASVEEAAAAAEARCVVVVRGGWRCEALLLGSRPLYCPGC